MSAKQHTKTWKESVSKQRWYPNTKREERIPHFLQAKPQIWRPFGQIMRQD
jgi:hypothetical protein